MQKCLIVYEIARFRIVCAGYKETCYPVVYAKEIRVSSEIQYMGRAYNDNFRLGNCCEKVPHKLVVDAFFDITS